MASGPSTAGFAVKFAGAMTALGTTAVKCLGPIVAVALIASLATKAIDLFWRGAAPKNQSPYRAAHGGVLDKKPSL